MKTEELLKKFFQLELSRRQERMLWAFVALVWIVLSIVAYMHGWLTRFLVYVMVPFVLTIAVLQLTLHLLKDYVKHKQKMQDY
jgi:Mn2+/Fe2+ NRAMP family transporter